MKNFKASGKLYIVKNLERTNLTFLIFQRAQIEFFKNFKGQLIKLCHMLVLEDVEGILHITNIYNKLQ